MLAWTEFGIGSQRTCCPLCGRGGRDKTLGVTIQADGKGVAHCFRCAFTASYRPDAGARHFVVAATGRVVAPQTFRELSDYTRAMWEAATPLTGAGLSYLNARRCRIPPADGDLRFHPALRHPSGFFGPALVALITDAATKRPLSLHRTWVQADGRKADVTPPRMLLARHRKQGGVIRLWPDDAVTLGLGVAEGVETALSLAWAYAPVWASIDAGNLTGLPVLAQVESLVIGADNDPAGGKAAAQCGQRWAGAGREVLITRHSHNDLNDILKGAE